MKRTICRKFKNCYINLLLQNTQNISNIIYSFLVTNFVILNNPQITKARSENLKPSARRRWLSMLRNSINFLNSFVYKHIIKYFNIQLRHSHTLFIEDSKKKSVLHNNTNKLNPYFVTGFTDGEGCFLINIRPNPKLKSGYSVELVFKINLHSKDRALLESIRNYFDVVDPLLNKPHKFGRGSSKKKWKISTKCE